MSKVFLGASALAGSNAVRLGLQLLLLPILARLLGPQAFGLVAVAASFILLANFLSDAGLGRALVRVSQPSRELESTVFWISTGLGAALAGLTLAAALLLDRVFNFPKLGPTLAALAPILVVSAALAVANARITRAQRLGVFAAGDLAGLLAGAAIAVALAFGGFGFWALVAQQLALWAVKAAIVARAARFRPALVCRPRLVREHIRFGLHAVGASMASFAARSAPILLVGAGAGATGAGYYSMAHQIVRLPEAIVAGPVAFTVFAAVARASSEAEAASALLLKSLRMVVAGLAPVFGGLALVAGPAVAVLLGENWTATAPVLAALAPAAFLLAVYATVNAALMGMGRADRQFRLSLGVLAATGLGALAGAAQGAVAVAVGVSVGCAAVAPFYARALSQAFALTPRRLVAELAAPIVATAGMSGAVWAAVQQTSDMDRLAALTAPVLTGLVVYPALLTAATGGQVWREVAALWGRPAVAASPAAASTGSPEP